MYLRHENCHGRSHNFPFKINANGDGAKTRARTRLLKYREIQTAPCVLEKTRVRVLFGKTAGPARSSLIVQIKNYSTPHQPSFPILFRPFLPCPPSLPLPDARGSRSSLGGGNKISPENGVSRLSSALPLVPTRIRARLFSSTGQETERTRKRRRGRGMEGERGFSYVDGESENSGN